MKNHRHFGLQGQSVGLAQPQALHLDVALDSPEFVGQFVGQIPEQFGVGDGPQTLLGGQAFLGPNEQEDIPNVGAGRD